jgi:hypothetical protein
LENYGKNLFFFTRSTRNTLSQEAPYKAETSFRALSPRK